MSAAELEMGPIDYVVIEWAGEPSGEGASILVDLVDSGVVRVLDLAFARKDEGGSVSIVEISEVAEKVPDLAVLEGASSGILVDDDIQAAGEAIEPGATAIVIVYENRWAAPFASAVRRGGGELVASGRIPAQDLIDALEAQPA